jgi:hypothetical protein
VQSLVSLGLWKTRKKNGAFGGKRLNSIMAASWKASVAGFGESVVNLDKCVKFQYLIPAG